MLATTFGFGDFAVIAWIVILIAVGAVYAERQRTILRRIERKVDALLKQQGVEPPAPPIVAGEVSDEVQHMAIDPVRRLDAIKLHRRQTGCDLADAKRDVEQFIKNVH
jgi:ribosomal protein L7/L12